MTCWHSRHLLIIENWKWWEFFIIARWSLRRWLYGQICNNSINQSSECNQLQSIQCQSNRGEKINKQMKVERSQIADQLAAKISQFKSLQTDWMVQIVFQSLLHSVKWFQLIHISRAFNQRILAGNSSRKLKYEVAAKSCDEYANEHQDWCQLLS